MHQCKHVLFSKCEFFFFIHVVAYHDIRNNGSYRQSRPSSVADLVGYLHGFKLCRFDRMLFEYGFRRLVATTVYRCLHFSILHWIRARTLGRHGRNFLFRSAYTLYFN